MYYYTWSGLYFDDDMFRGGVKIEQNKKDTISWYDVFQVLGVSEDDVKY